MTFGPSFASKPVLVRGDFAGVNGAGPDRAGASGGSGAQGGWLREALRAFTLRPVTIAQRAVLCLVALSAVALAQCAASLFLSHSLRRNAEVQHMLSDVRVAQMYGDMKHDGIQGDVFRLIDATQAHDAVRVEATRKAIAFDIGEINAAYGKVFAQGYGPELQAKVNGVRADERAFVDQAGAMALQMQANPADYRGQLARFTDAFDRFEISQNTLAAALKQESRDRDGDAEAVTRVTLVMQMLIMGLGAAAMAWAMRLMLRDVVAPIARLAAMMRGMARGDFSAGEDEGIFAGSGGDGGSGGDEIAQMAAATRAFRETARAKQAVEADAHAVVAALTAGMGRLAQKDLEYRIETAFPHDYDGLRENFNQAVQSLSGALGSVRQGAAALSDSIGEIRTASDDLAQRNEEQAASLEATSAAMNEVTLSVRETAEGAARVQRSIAQAQGEATEGGQVVSRAVEAMAAIEKSAQEISQIINMIDGIAFQTNLLALNAGVEAARAGDAGKGFAVVANEVRALAQRSAAAARDIKELIQTSSSQVGHGVTLVGATGEKLGQIVARVDEMTLQVTEIASAAQRQSAKLSQVNAAMGEMDRVTQQNAAMVEQTTAATRSLAEEAGQLARMVCDFRTRSPGGSNGGIRAGLARHGLPERPNFDRREDWVPTAELKQAAGQDWAGF